MFQIVFSEVSQKVCIVKTFYLSGSCTKKISQRILCLYKAFQKRGNILSRKAAGSNMCVKGHLQCLLIHTSEVSEPRVPVTREQRKSCQ
jgi:hypothetical protein